MVKIEVGQLKVFGNKISLRDGDTLIVKPFDYGVIVEVVDVVGGRVTMPITYKDENQEILEHCKLKNQINN